MQINGQIKICNKWVNGEIDKTQFDFEDRGSVSFGSLQWTNVKKGKNGAKDEFTTTVKKFAIFDAHISGFVQANIEQKLEIKGELVGNTYLDKKDGSKKKSEQVIISEATLAVVKDKQNDYQKDTVGLVPQKSQYQEEEDDATIPF